MAFKMKSKIYERESKNYSVLNENAEKKIAELKKREKKYDVK